MARILVIDDERAIRNTLKEILEFESYTVEVAENGRIGLERALGNAFDLIFTDIKMPEMDGMEFLQAYHEGMAQQNSEEAPVVVITGHGSVDTAVESLKGGAFDFIQKPLDLNRLLVTTKHAIDHKSLVQETKVLRKKVGKRNQMIGESAAIARVRAIIDKVAPTEARVLITGSNGTGKEVVAHLIHENSQGMTVAVGMHEWLSATMVNTNYTMFCAAGVLVAIPVVTVFLLLQKYYVEGVTGGAVKG